MPSKHVLLTSACSFETDDSFNSLQSHSFVGPNLRQQMEYAKKVVDLMYLKSLIYLDGIPT